MDGDLATFLLQQGWSVVEVCRPARTVSGQSTAKDDVIDAEKAARQVLSGQATVTPKWADGQVEMSGSLRLPKIRRLRLKPKFWSLSNRCW